MRYLALDIPYLLLLHELVLAHKRQQQYGFYLVAHVIFFVFVLNQPIEGLFGFSLKILRGYHVFHSVINI